MQGSANLNLMIKAARKAGRILVKDFREVENLQVSTKGPGDFVTPPMAGSARKPARRTGSIRPGAGWSIRWTAPPTSCTECRTGRFP